MRPANNESRAKHWNDRIIKANLKVMGKVRFDQIFLSPFSNGVFTLFVVKTEEGKVKLGAETCGALFVLAGPS